MGADAEGPRARLERVFIEHANAVRRYARLHVGDGPADDVVAETFLVAWRRLDDIPTAALPWLLGVARNVVSNQHRGRGRGTRRWSPGSSSSPHRSMGRPSARRWRIGRRCSRRWGGSVPKTRNSW